MRLYNTVRHVQIVIQNFVFSFAVVASIPTYAADRLVMQSGYIIIIGG